MRRMTIRGRLWSAAAIIMVLAGAGGVLLVDMPTAKPSTADPKAATPAIPVSVAAVTPRPAMTWNEFSGRLEAIERVEVRSRVAGAVETVHFREGAVVNQGDLLVTIDPAPYAAEVNRLQAQVAAANARVFFTKAELDRGQQLLDSRTLSTREVDQRTNAYREADANLQAAKAALQAAQLNLDYTQIRAPVAGRVGRLEITIGNLVAAGPGAPVLTTLVSLHPIYASFNVEEEVVQRALHDVGSAAAAARDIDRIPVQMTLAADQRQVDGRLQLIDNQVDGRTGTVRVRAIFDNADGRLMPGQFARLRMGSTETPTVLAVSERAIGTDQSKKFVLVVDGDNKATYREVTLGTVADGLRIVTSGLTAGERIVVNGLQRVRPGALVAPEPVAMEAKSATQARLETPTTER